jgi:SAM-dependent methyltransferase
VDLLLMSPLVRSNSKAIRIADLGCGNERLYAILNARLRRPFGYKGYDLHPQSERVTRLDVDREMPGETFDVVFCLGLIEYLRDAEMFAQKLRHTTHVAIVSYAITDAATASTSPERRRLGWRTDYTRADLEKIFEATGFERGGFQTVLNGTTGLWLWRAHSE